MDYSDLEKLDQLRQKGVISDEEFEAQKKRFFDAMHEQEDQQNRKREEERSAREAEERRRREQEQRAQYNQQSNPTYSNFSTPSNLHWGMSEQTFCILMHLGIFAGWLIPLVGWVLPFAMWLTEKDKSARIDKHGKIVANWLITYFIFGFVLVFIPILGWIAAIIMGICNLIFAIMGAVKASEGGCYEYPLSLKLIK